MTLMTPPPKKKKKSQVIVISISLIILFDEFFLVLVRQNLMCGVNSVEEFDSWVDDLSPDLDITIGVDLGRAGPRRCEKGGGCS